MSDIKFLDNKMIRSINSEYFHFVLDKESNVSICWGKDENENPLFDPISPQIITWEINKNTKLIDIINQINVFIDVRYRSNKKLVNIDTLTEENYNIIFQIPTIVSVSTVTHIIFNIKQEDNTYISKILDMLQIISKYLKMFDIKTQIQINSNLSQNNIQKLKFITEKIYINYSLQDTNYNLLLNNNFKTEIVLYVNKNNFHDIIKSLQKLKKKTNGIIYLTNELISITQLRELEGRVKNLNLSLMLHGCNLVKYNKDNKVTLHDIFITNCEATTYKIYIKDGQLYSCEFNDKPLGNIIKDESPWFNPTIDDFRQKIIKDTYC